MKKLLTMCFIAIAAMLSACENSSTSKLITFEPSSLPTCDKASEVGLKWDVRNAYPGVQAVQIVVIDGATEVVFGEGGAIGETKTGAWVRPGIPRFVLKDKANGKVLGEAVVKGPKCQ